MTPREKAKHLVDKFQVPEMCDRHYQRETFRICRHMAKECALYCVDEIIQAIDWHDHETPNKELDYWNEVKKEINEM